MPSGGLYATYHLLGEPETTIEDLAQWLGSLLFRSHEARPFIKGPRTPHLGGENDHHGQINHVSVTRPGMIHPPSRGDNPIYNYSRGPPCKSLIKALFLGGGVALGGGTGYLPMIIWWPWALSRVMLTCELRGGEVLKLTLF